MAGLSDFVNAVASGDRTYEQAFTQAQGRNAAVDAAMTKARLAQREAAARERLGDALMRMGVENPLPTATALESGLVDYGQLSKGATEAQTRGFRGEAFDTARAGDVDLMNRLVSVIAEKPLTRTEVGEGVAYDPFAAPTAQEIQALPLGEQMRGASGVQSTQVDASGNLWLITREGKAIPATDQSGKQIKARVPGGAAGIRVVEGVDPMTGKERFEVVDIGGGQAPTVVPKPKTTATQTTDAERKAAGFYERMKSAQELLSGMEGAGYDPTSLRDTFTAGRGMANYLATPEGQNYRQAQENWVRANLRKESGAVIGADEMDAEIKNYFPKPGDGPEVVAQKRRNRDLLERNMQREAGRALEQASPLGQQMLQQPPGKYQVGQIIEAGGKRYRVTGGDVDDPDVEEVR